MDDWELAEQRTQWLLEDRDLPFRREPALEEWIQVVGPRPDFVVQFSRTKILIEVKCLQKMQNRFPSPDDNGTTYCGWDGSKTHSILRAKIKDAEDQLKPYEDTGMPALIVLDVVNPVATRFDLSFEELELLYGIRTWDSTSNTISRHDRILRSDQKKYISAIAIQKSVDAYESTYPKIGRQRMRIQIMPNRFARVGLPEEVIQVLESVACYGLL